MSQIVIIAGPQAAGKSTVIANLNRRFIKQRLVSARSPVLFVLQESRQIIAHKNISLGAIFMTPAEECEAVECDLNRMNLILRRDHRHVVFIDECNIFTIAHALAHGIKDLEQYREAYYTRLKALHAAVVFLDVPPALSWERRRKQYDKRLVYFPRKDHADITMRYRRYLELIHPLLHEMYESLPFPKAMIDATGGKSLLIKK